MLWILGTCFGCGVWKTAFWTGTFHVPIRMGHVMSDMSRGEGGGSVGTQGYTRQNQALADLRWHVRKRRQTPSPVLGGIRQVVQPSKH